MGLSKQQGVLMRTRTTAILCALLLAPLLSSCGAGGPRADESNDLWDAQFALAQVEEQMASKVPSENVVDTRTSPSQYLSSCSNPKTDKDKDEWRWREVKTIELTGYLDQQQFLREAEQEILDQDGWKKEPGNYGDGEQKIAVEHEDGSFLFLSFGGETPETFMIQAVTDCYYLPNYNYMDETTYGG